MYTNNFKILFAFFPLLHGPPIVSTKKIPDDTSLSRDREIGKDTRTKNILIGIIKPQLRARYVPKTHSKETLLETLGNIRSKNGEERKNKRSRTIVYFQDED